MILVLSVDGKSPGQIFVVCIWDVAGLSHLRCGNEGISLVGTNPPAVLPPTLLYHSSIFFPLFHLLPGKMIIQILPEVETLGLGPDDVPKLTEQVRDSMLSTYQEISGMMNGASH